MIASIIPLSKNAKDITGETFGRLTAIAPVRINKRGNVVWLCICECGTEKYAQGNLVFNGRTSSCGCIRGESIKTHGMTGSQEHNAWWGLRSRCLNKAHRAYKNYGGRGITYDKGWDSFDKFYADMGDAPSSEHSIDRIDNNGDYTKANCRWATPKQQARNKRGNKMITYKDKTMCISEWAEHIGITRGALGQRLGNNWSIDRAMTTPLRVRSIK